MRAAIAPDRRCARARGADAARAVEPELRPVRLDRVGPRADARRRRRTVRARGRAVVEAAARAVHRRRSRSPASAAPALWLLVARAGLLLALAGAYALAARLRRRLAGVVGVLAVLLLDGVVSLAWRGASEPLLLAAVLWAVERHLAGARRTAFALGVAAALIRPEVAPFVDALRAVAVAGGGPIRASPARGRTGARAAAVDRRAGARWGPARRQHDRAGTRRRARAPRARCAATSPSRRRSSGCSRSSPSRCAHVSGRPDARARGGRLARADRGDGSGRLCEPGALRDAGRRLRVRARRGGRGGDRRAHARERHRPNRADRPRTCASWPVRAGAAARRRAGAAGGGARGAPRRPGSRGNRRRARRRRAAGGHRRLRRRRRDASLRARRLGRRQPHDAVGAGVGAAREPRRRGAHDEPTGPARERAAQHRHGGPAGGDARRSGAQCADRPRGSVAGARGAVRRSAAPAACTRRKASGSPRRIPNI